jgi:hypothetical protein
LDSSKAYQTAVTLSRRRPQEADSEHREERSTLAVAPFEPFYCPCSSESDSILAHDKTSKIATHVNILLISVTAAADSRASHIFTVSSTRRLVNPENRGIETHVLSISFVA